MKPPHLPLLALLAAATCSIAFGMHSLQDDGDAPSASRFAGQTVVITGANRGLGLEFARQFMDAGALVIGTTRTPEAARELASTEARVLALDVTDEASVAAFAAALGDEPVHLLINNAGVGGASFDASLSRAERTRLILDVNTLGPMRVVEALLPNLQAAGKPIVVNISSRLGSLSANSTGGYPGYRESKAALNMYTRSLAAETREQGFVVVCVSPGWVRTDMGGPNADLEPEESIAGLRGVIEVLGAEDSGKFLHYDGTQLDW